MNFDHSNWALIGPELLLLAAACAILILDLAVTSRLRTLTHGLTLATLAAVAWILGAAALGGQTGHAFGHMVVIDPMGNWLKCFATIAVMVTLIYGRAYAADRGMLRGGELFSLSMFALLGMFTMISGGNFLVLYMGLELLTLASYAMVALRRDSALASEAAMKYFVLGALASGFLLYGLSMLYGATGSLDLAQVFAAIASGQIKHQVLVFGVVFIVAGLAFKLGVVPFHMWVPDVYHGAPTPVTLFIGSAPKLAAFAMAIRLLTDGLGGLASEWQMMLVLLSVASMAIGNLVAIAQTNMKRMLAYSTISHMGFLLLGLLSARTGGYAASMFYVIVYAVMSMGAFGSLIVLSSANSESDRLADFAGLSKRSPWIAFLMLIIIFSLAGVPPFAGFWAKWFVLKEVVAAGYSWLAIFAVVFSLIGAYYYLRIIKLMYFDEPESGALAITAGDDVRMVFSVNSLTILLLGLLPGTLMSVCLAAMLAYGI